MVEAASSVSNYSIQTTNDSLKVELTVELDGFQLSRQEIDAMSQRSGVAPSIRSKATSKAAAQESSDGKYSTRFVCAETPD